MNRETLIERARARKTSPPPDQCRRIREEAGASLAEVGAVVGVSASAVWRWEHGLRHPAGDNLTRYVSLLEALS